MTYDADDEEMIPDQQDRPADHDAYEEEEHDDKDDNEEEDEDEDYADTEALQRDLEEMAREIDDEPNKNTDAEGVPAQAPAQPVFNHDAFASSTGKMITAAINVPTGPDDEDDLVAKALQEPVQLTEPPPSKATKVSTLL